MSSDPSAGPPVLYVRNEITVLADRLGLDYDTLMQAKRTQYEKSPLGDEPSCMTCGASVSDDRRAMHSRWHLLLDLRAWNPPESLGDTGGR